MTDLEINIALAKAMGWDNLQMDYFGNPMQILVPQHRDVLYCWDKGVSKIFDYRDPVIFVAICKHWKLVLYFPPSVNATGFVRASSHNNRFIESDSIEKAAALCVIDAANRGVK